MKEKIAELLRFRIGEDTAAKFLRSGHVTLPYGGYVNVIVTENLDDTMEVGVNWSAIGTVGANQTFTMARNLGRAADVAEAVQDIIDGYQN